MQRFLACFAAVMVALAPCANVPLQQHEEEPAKQSEKELAARIDEYGTRSAAFGFSGVVLVAKRGEIVLCQGYGVADRSSGAAFTAETAIDLGSVTKQFTAAAILKLEMLGKLRTDDLIEKFLEGVPSDKRSITIHHLLTHTSGLERGEGDRTEIVSRDEMVKRILATPLIADVGAKHSYSNSGYTLLAAVIERASSQSFRAFLREQFFDPLGMTRTGFYGDSGRWKNGPVARSYFETAEEGNPLDWPSTWAATGGGHVMSTALDVFRWDCELRGGHILSPEAKEKLIGRYVDSRPGWAYGYGWQVGGAPGARLAFHTGYYKSFGCEYRRYLDRDTTVFVATNVGYSGGTAQQVAMSEPIAQIALGNEQALPPAVVRLDERALERVCGSYRSASGAQLRVRKDRGQLNVEATGQEAFDVLSGSEGERVSSELETLNARTTAVIEALTHRDRGALEQVLAPRRVKSGASDSNDGDASLAPSLTTMWSSLVERFGALRRFEVLGTAAYPFNDVDVRTYVEAEFEHISMILTVGYRDGRLFDVSTWDGAPNPAAMVLAPLSADVFATYDLWSAKGTSVEFRANDAGEISELVVAPRGRRLVFERAR